MPACVRVRVIATPLEEGRCSLAGGERSRISPTSVRAWTPAPERPQVSAERCRGLQLTVVCRPLLSSVAFALDHQDERTNVAWYVIEMGAKTRPFDLS